MTSLFRQYRTEIRNICLIALVAMTLPYLSKLAEGAMTTAGMMIIMSLAGALVLAMTLKVYFRILVMRITNDNKAAA